MDVQMANLTINESEGKNLLRLDILISTSSMQGANGIKQNDYYRYSRFCQTKINKLRKLYKITQGKRKFNKIEINSELLVDSKVLLIPVLECERKWAKGMMMKAHMTNVGQDIKPLRYNISKKFKKAAQQAHKLYELCKDTCDTQTILEAEAYFSFLQANYFILKRKFEEALNLLKRAANIYEKISSIKDTIESISYKDKINNIKTSIRLCVYNLSTSKDIVFDEDQFATEMIEDNLTEQIEEIRKTKDSSAKEGDSYDIKYQGMVIPIKNEKIKFIFNKINEVSNKIEEETDLTKKVNTYTDIFNHLDEIVKVVKKEKTDDKTQADSKPYLFILDFAKIYTKLLAYVQNLRLKKYIEKNLAYIKDYSQDFKSLTLITDMVEKDNVKLRIKPQEVIKLFENLLEYQNQLINLEKENPDGSYLIDLNFRSQVYLLNKIFYIGMFYLLNKKFEDVYTIMHHILEKVKEVNEYYDNYKLSSIPALKEIRDSVDNLENLVRFTISKTYVRLTKEKQGELTSQIAKDKTKPKYHGWMYEEIQRQERITQENFEAIKDNVKLPYEEYEEAIEKTNYNNYSHVMQVPPNTKMLDPKPIVYDLTFQRFQYPNLENKKKTEGKGIFSRALGYFWNK